jgi:hypothetical protein
MDYTKRFHELYENARELVDKDISDWGDKLIDISDKDEQDFYLAVTTYFLQKRQKDVIDKGLF